MGQTLTHGIYLPDEGERNCYDGLASNWSILDGAVGTVAEHTSQIAGKAPAVHTHTKADITDFPAYGNAAGTICEGNDSRLSDARTPVAHTHTKADVTDLFNSANTWTGDNTFSGSNSFNSVLTINNAALLNAVLQNAVKGNISTTGDFAIFIKDKVNGNAATSLLAVYRGGQDSEGSYAQVNIDTKGNDNNRYNNSILFRINPADNSNNAVFIPQRDKTIDLGTSLNQWKSFNGLNPGALSLPDVSRETTIDTTNWSYTGTQVNQVKINNAVQTLNGWLFIRISNISSSDFITVKHSSTARESITFIGSYNPGVTYMTVCCPVMANVPVYVWLTKQPEYIKFYSSLGEVNNFPT